MRHKLYFQIFMSYKIWINNFKKQFKKIVIKFKKKNYLKILQNLINKNLKKLLHKHKLFY